MADSYIFATSAFMDVAEALVENKNVTYCDPLASSMMWPMESAVALSTSLETLALPVFSVIASTKDCVAGTSVPRTPVVADSVQVKAASRNGTHKDCEVWPAPT